MESAASDAGRRRCLPSAPIATGDTPPDAAIRFPVASMMKARPLSPRRREFIQSDSAVKISLTLHTPAKLPSLLKTGADSAMPTRRSTEPRNGSVQYLARVSLTLVYQGVSRVSKKTPDLRKFPIRPSG